jgi:hypothetical protein
MSFIAVSARTTNTTWISPEYTQADQDALQRYAEPVEAAQALDGRSSSEDEVLNARDLWLSEENELLDIYPASIDDHGLAGVKGQIHLAKMAVSQSILHTAERMREAGRFGDASSLLVDGVMIMDRGKYSGFASLAQADKTQEVLINRLADLLEHLTPEQSVETARRLQGVRTSDENRARIAKRLAAAYATEKASGQNGQRAPGVVASLHDKLASTPLEDRVGPFRRSLLIF